MMAGALAADKPPGLAVLKILGIIGGLTLIVVGAVCRASAFCTATANVSILLITTYVCVFLAEGAFRLVGFDFAREEINWNKLPPYYRDPMVPTGEVYFRRSGPDEWTGQVLNTRMKQLGIEPNPYENDPVVTIAYDSNGFRNPIDLREWEIVVAGDSFTELSHLTDEELFTTLLQSNLEVRVLNLGASRTGPLSQLSYIKNYGISPPTKVSLIVFFEGNDLRNLEDEYSAFRRWQQTGQRDYREFNTQTSMLKAFYRFVIHLSEKQKTPNALNAYFVTANGDVPITLSYTPPSRSGISKDVMEAFDFFFVGYAALAEAEEITPWLAFMPCKRRVFHGHIKFEDQAGEEIKKWQPTDLPETLEELCAEHGINFIDFTPTLVRETLDSGAVLFNPIYDSHLNTQGAAIIAQELARRLRP
jgi:hypothetical protein